MLQKSFSWVECSTSREGREDPNSTRHQKWKWGSAPGPPGAVWRSWALELSNERVNWKHDEPSSHFPSNEP
jgi:hypothetical protein